MIGKVLVRRIPLREAEIFMALIRVPANEVNRIAELVSVVTPVSGVATIVIPGRVLGLSIAVGGRSSWQWYKEKFRSVGANIVPKLDS